MISSSVRDTDVPAYIDNDFSDTLGRSQINHHCERSPSYSDTPLRVTIQLGLEPKGVAVSGDIFSLGVLLNEILYNYLVRCSKQGSIQRVRHVSKDTSSLSPVFA